MGTIASYETEGTIYGKYMLQSIKDAKIGVLYQNDDLGRDYSLDFLGPEVLKLEQIAEELPRALRDDDCVWLGNPLQTCRKVRRLPDDAALLRYMPGPRCGPARLRAASRPFAGQRRHLSGETRR